MRERRKRQSGFSLARWRHGKVVSEARWLARRWRHGEVESVSVSERGSE